MDIKKIFNSVAEKLRLDFDYTSSEIQHSASKGKVREAEIVNIFLKEYLPKTVEVVNGGEIVSTGDQTSNECDIIISDAQHCPIFIDKTGFRITPIECVYGVIEVKSNLGAKELIDSYKKIKNVKTFPKIAYEPPNGPIRNFFKVYDKEFDYFPLIGMVFAYNSIDLIKLRDQLEELQKNDELEHKIDAVWVLNKGMIINWEDENKKITHTPSKRTKLIPVASENPLLLMTIHMQQLFQASQMRPFNIFHYMKNINYGKILT